MECYDEYSKELLTEGEIHDFPMAAGEDGDEEKYSKEHGTERKHAADIVAAAPFVLAQEAASSCSSSAGATIIYQNNWKPSLVKQQQRQNQQINSRRLQEKKSPDDFVYDVSEYDSLLSHTRRHHMIGQQVWYEVRGERRRITDSEARRLIEKFENDPRLSKSPIRPRILVKVAGTSKNEFGQYQCRLASLADIRKNVNTKRDSNSKQQQKQDHQLTFEQFNGKGNLPSVATTPKKRKTSSSPPPTALAPPSPGKDIQKSFIPIVTPGTSKTEAPIGRVANNKKGLNASGVHGKTLRVILSDYSLKLQILEQECYNSNSRESMTHCSAMNGGADTVTVAAATTIMYQIYDFRKTLDVFLALPFTDQLPHTLMDLALEGYHQIVNTTKTLWARLRRLCDAIPSSSGGKSASADNHDDDNGNMDASSSAPPSSPGKKGPGNGENGSGMSSSNAESCDKQQTSSSCNGGTFWSVSVASHTNCTTPRHSFAKRSKEDVGRTDVVKDGNIRCDDSIEGVSIHDDDREIKKQESSLESEEPTQQKQRGKSDDDDEDDDDDEKGPDNDRGGAAATIVPPVANRTSEVSSPQPQRKTKQNINPALSSWKEPPFDFKEPNRSKAGGNQHYRPKASLRDTWIRASCDNGSDFSDIKPAASQNLHEPQDPADKRGNEVCVVTEEDSPSRVIRTRSRNQSEPRRTPSLLGVDVSASATSYMLMCTKNSFSMKRVRSTGCVKARLQLKRDERYTETRGTTGTSSFAGKNKLEMARPQRSPLESKHRQSRPSDTRPYFTTMEIGSQSDHQEKGILQRMKGMRLTNKQATETEGDCEDDRSKPISQRHDFSPPSFCQISGNGKPAMPKRTGWKLRTKFSSAAKAGEGSNDLQGSLANPISTSATTFGSLKATAKLSSGGYRNHTSSSDLGPSGCIDPSKSLYRLW